MTKEEMLKKLRELPHPITEDLVVFDDGCEFYILTRQKGYACTVGGAFPINGPLRLSAAQHSGFSHMLSLQGSDSLEEAIDEHVHNEIKRSSLLNLLSKAGEAAIKEAFRVKLPAGKYFYVFHDMGRKESAMFPTLKSAYEYFLTYFMGSKDGILWELMDADDLAGWVERAECWRVRGSKKLPPREWLGAYYNPQG